jgi:predicted enzyme related to lactoylglutathione lyase
MGDPATNFEINSGDPEKARRFYTSVFGWKMNEVPETGYTFVDTDAGNKGIGGGIGPLRGPKPFVTFYVVVRDLDATLKKATDAGGKVVFPATKVGPTTTIALFSDLDGNVIGLTDGN